MTLRRIFTVLGTIALAAFARPATAQQVDVIRGRVVGPDSLPIENVRVTVTTISGAVSRNAVTDRNGRYTVTFPGGDGDYLVTFALMGFAPRRFQVKRVADEDFLVADARLQRAANVLDAVTVRAPRDRANRNDATPDISGTEQAVNPANLAANQLGDLTALAASVPGVLLVPGADGDPSGYSVLGLSPDQNSSTLNGQNYDGSNLPRDASVSVSLATSPYDVSRGGFSGGQMNVRTRPGTNFILRTNSLTLDAPGMQWTDPAARALGQEYLSGSLGGLVSGPIKYDHSFYNLSYQLGRRQNDLQTLLDIDPVGLAALGIAPDSVARLLDVLSALQIPTTVRGVSSNRLNDDGRLLASFDFAPPSSRNGSAYSITVNGGWSRQTPVPGPQTEFPAHSGDRTNWNAALQGRHSTYFSFGVLSETSIGFVGMHNAGSPYLDLPSGMARILSSFPDGGDGAKNVLFGGSSSLDTRGTNTSVGVTNQLSWFSADNKHRLKLSSELRRDGYALDQSSNQLGSFTFNSLGDLEAGRPSSYTRMLSPRERSGSQIIGALALGDSYKHTNNLQLQYGLRLDGNFLTGRPPVNAEVERLFDVRNDHVPNRVYVSPRLGFSYTYGTAAQIGGFEGAMRGPRSVIRGGVGIFQGLPGTQALGNAIDNTGLPGGLQQLTCMGIAAPQPDWSQYLEDRSTIPALCADGTHGSIFASSAPNVSFFADDYVASRSVRSNLQWNGPVLGNRFSATVDVTYSRNINQPGTLDLNFAPNERFTLASEAGRPVFVQASSIDPVTGAIASRDARVSQQFNRVTESRSDLTSESRQVRVSISPGRFSSTYSWSLSYVTSNTRDRTRGFGAGNTVGNPLDLAWSRSGFDSRHQIQYSLYYNAFDLVRVSWSGSFRSGMPFTPMVAGDVNGDGYSNDRAFVMNPGTTADPTLAASMQSLLTNAPSKVRQCLESQLGNLAKRNSCEGPWTSQANLSISFNPLKVRMPQRATLSFSVSNPLGAADMMLHDDKNLRGWGQFAVPDQSLLFVRGFDPATQRFRYEVNQRFGATNPAFTSNRNPVTVTAMLRFDIGPTRERQSLVQQLNQGRRTGGNKLPEGLFRAMYSTGSIVNPMATILRQSDSLSLSATQADSIANLNRWYVVRLDSIWTPVAKFLAALPDNYDSDEAYSRYQHGRKATIDLLRRLGPEIKGLLTDEQRRKLPALVASYLDPRYLASIRSGTAGAGGGGPSFAPGGMGPMALPAGGAGAQTIIVR